MSGKPPWVSRRQWAKKQRLLKEIEARARIVEEQPSPKRCSIRQWSDQMSCSTCHLIWDTNDPDPPMCPKTGTQVPENGAHEIDH